VAVAGPRKNGRRSHLAQCSLENLKRTLANAKSGL
jgi:hypothetical protein